MMKRYGLILASLAFLSLISRWIPVPAIIAQGVSRGPLIMQNGGTPIGAAITLNCSTGLTCTNSGGTVTATASGTSLSLETNGTPNGSQTLLNLEQGTGITLVDNGSGTVTIASTGGAGAANPSCTFSALDTGCTAPTTSIDVSSLGATSNDQFLVQCWTGASTTQTAVAVTSYVYTTGSGIIQTVAPAFSAAAAAGYCVANGNGSGGTGGSGSFVLVEEHTASGSAALNFTSCISSTYDDYAIRVLGMQPATGGVKIGIQMSSNGGSTYDTTSGHYWWQALAVVPSTSGTNGSTSDTQVNFSNDQSNNSAESLGGDFSLHTPQNGTIPINMNGSFQGFTSGSQRIGWIFTGSYTNLVSVNAFRIIATSGNLAAGTVRCYGLTH